MFTSTSGPNFTAALVSLIVLLLAFFGVIGFLVCCSEWPQRRLSRHAQLPDEAPPLPDAPTPGTASTPGTQGTSSAEPIAIPGAVAASVRPRAGDGTFTESSSNAIPSEFLTSSISLGL